MVQESVWSAVMTLLAQARIEASDTASAPPLVMVKREQVTDILGLLEPFEEALQVTEQVKNYMHVMYNYSRHQASVHIYIFIMNFPNLYA